MQKSKVKFLKMRNITLWLKGGHDKLGTKGGGLSQCLNDEGPILVEVEGLLPFEGNVNKALPFGSIIFIGIQHPATGLLARNNSYHPSITSLLQGELRFEISRKNSQVSIF